MYGWPNALVGKRFHWRHDASASKVRGFPIGPQYLTNSIIQAPGYKMLRATHTPTNTNTAVGNSRYSGAVLTPRGHIVFLPRNDNYCMVLDPYSKKTWETAVVCARLGSNYVGGGVLAPNGHIYAFPWHKDVRILDLDTYTWKINSQASTGYRPDSSHGSSTHGAVLGADGNIYGVPHFYPMTQVPVYDPRTNKSWGLSCTTTINTTPDNKWAGGVLAPNGCIYCAPHSETTILKIDTYNRKVTQFGSFAGTAGKWIGGALGLDNRIYFCPYNATTILVVEPMNNDKTYELTAPVYSYQGAVLGSDGMIHFMPRASIYSFWLNPATQKTYTYRNSINSYGSYGKAHGGVMAPNGCIYGAPLYPNTNINVTDYTIDIMELDLHHGPIAIGDLLIPERNKF